MIAQPQNIPQNAVEILKSMSQRTQTFNIQENLPETALANSHPPTPPVKIENEDVDILHKLQSLVGNEKLPDSSRKISETNSNGGSHNPTEILSLELQDNIIQILFS